MAEVKQSLNGLHFLSTERINRGRQIEFDTARIVTLFLMGIIHTTVKITDFSGDATLSSNFYELFIAFIGGPLGAPIFLFAMGVGMVYTKVKDPKVFAVRGTKLIFQGFLLNFVKDTIPTLIANAADLDGYPDSVLKTLFRTDILQFSGFSFLVIALFNALNLHCIYQLLATLLLQGIGTVLIGQFDDLPETAKLILGLIFYTSDSSAFPLTLYLIYPVAGICFAELLQFVHDKTRFYVIIFLCSLAIFAAVTFDCIYIDYDLRYFFVNYNNYYKKMHLLSSIWILSCDLILLPFYYLVSCYLPQFFLIHIKKLSALTTSIYVIHWLILSSVRLIKYATDWEDISKYLAFPIGICLIAVAMFLATCYKKVDDYLHIKLKEWKHRRSVPSSPLDQKDGERQSLIVSS